MPTYRSNGLSPALPRRTLDYLERGAPEGTRNAELFDAACQMRDAGQSPEQAETQLLPRALADGLGEAEARQTIQSVYARSARDPVRCAPKPASLNGHGKTLLAPIKDGFSCLLEACFRPDEYVAISHAAENEDGEIAPRRGVTLTAAQWQEKIHAKGGIDHCFTTKLGLFVRINPMRRDGSRNEDVTVFRHALVEFDQGADGKPVPKEEQLRVITESGLPVSALIDSGNKSLHAWIRVDAPDEKEYRRRVDLVWKHFEGNNLDRQNRNPSRLSRCPDGWRTVAGEPQRQNLLATKLGAKSWQAWEEARSASGLPPILPGTDFMAREVPEPVQLVEGVLHKGAKMVLGGPSKARKSWSLIDLMLSISTGSTWWGLPTRQGRSLYLNFELPAFALQHRIRRISGAKGISEFSGFDVWNLRGHSTDFSQLIPKILSKIKDTGYALVIIDPIYKGLGPRSENDAGDIASLLNEVEQLAEQSGAAVVFGAHFSKGNQAAKESIDRIGGSGVFARDPDVILTMTPHEEEQAHVIDLTLRALPPVAPFVVRWNEAVFEPDASADPSKPLQPGQAPKPAPRTTYKRGKGVAGRLGVLFHTMPPLEHQSPKIGPSAVLEHICRVMSEHHEEISIEEAHRVFNILRNDRYRVLVHCDGLWQGRKFSPLGTHESPPTN